MRIVIGRIGYSDTVKFAVSELVRYLKKIDKTLIIDRRNYKEYDEKVENVIFVGKIAQNDDVIDNVKINIANGAGYITGSNDRSVLIAVYKTLEALGCKWIRPSDDGEFIPERELERADLNVSLDHTPSYRHRGICLEGANTYENVYDIINWLPKVGMNEYFIQFHIPFSFFKRWYREHDDGAGPVTLEDTVLLTENLEEEIKLRGLTYHKVGHGWTYPLIGELGSGWTDFDYSDSIPADVKKLFAEVDGKRDVWKGSLFDTNLCYSSPEAREKFIDGVVDYCKNNPHVDYVHFWLADAMNNHCECENCKKMMPVDWYVMMLNELDDRLTAEGMNTKVVFLLYLELLWTPEFNDIKNPDRFTMMFAPITRSYTETYVEGMSGKEEAVPPYERNKIVLPREVDKNLAFLKAWQKKFTGDSFVFDYHIMWDYAVDAGSYRIARVVHDDMKNLDKIGLDGMMSCQIHRVSVPTCLPTYAMARALWDKTSDFDKVSNEYFEVSFDRDGKKVEEYLKKLSAIYDSADADKYEKVIAEIEDILPMIETNMVKVQNDEKFEMSWKYLYHHAKLWILICEAFIQKREKNADAAMAKYEECRAYVRACESEVQRGMDVYKYLNATLNRKLKFLEDGKLIVNRDADAE